MTNTIFGTYKCRRILKNGGLRDYIILHRRVEGITGAQALMRGVLLSSYFFKTNFFKSRICGFSILNPTLELFLLVFHHQIIRGNGSANYQYDAERD